MLGKYLHHYMMDNVFATGTTNDFFLIEFALADIVKIKHDWSYRVTIVTGKKSIYYSMFFCEAKNILFLKMFNEL